MTAKRVNDRIDEAYKYFGDVDDKDDGGENDTTAMGHLALDNQRRLLTYMRLIENEIPQLVGA